MESKQGLDQICNLAEAVSQLGNEGVFLVASGASIFTAPDYRSFAGEYIEEGTSLSAVPVGMYNPR